MSELETALHDHQHEQFDALCAGVEDYERLPELTGSPADPAPWRTAEDRIESIDDEILAGLVSP